MKQIGCLICLAVLLAGCSPWEMSRPLTRVESGFFHAHGENQFIVEGNAYHYTCIYGLQYVCCADDNLIYSLTLVFPQGQHYYPLLWYIGEEIKGQIYAQDTRTTIYASYSGDENTTPNEEDSRKIADVPFHYIYFIDNDKIVFQKSNKEVGFDIPALVNINEAEKRLRTILEQLIRENVPPQEPEMEEKQPL